MAKLNSSLPAWTAVANHAEQIKRTHLRDLSLSIIGHN